MVSNQDNDKFMMNYLNLYNCLGQRYLQNVYLNLSYSDFCANSFIQAFSLKTTPEQDLKFLQSISKSGVLRLDILFSAATTFDLQVLFILEYGSHLTVDSTGIIDCYTA